MAKFAYTPLNADEPEVITCFGQEWTAGKTATLRDVSFLTIAMGNPSFDRKDKPDDDEKADAAARTQQEADRAELEQLRAEKAEREKTDQMRTSAQAKTGEGSARDDRGPARPAEPVRESVPGQVAK